MPRSVPIIAIAGETRWEVSIRYIDATGDRRSESYLFTAQPTEANIEALTAALGAQSNGDIFEVHIDHIFAAIPDASNATNTTRASVSQNIVYLAKHADGSALNLFVPAPLEVCFVLGTDEVDPVQGLGVNTLAAWVNLLPAGFGVVSARFSGRREKNKAVKI